jgi:pimeloyl-ACP methyl ester carboxylesterase
MTEWKMPQDSSEDSSRFLAHVDAWDQHETLFEKFYQKTDADKDSIGGLRRRRKRASNASDAPIKTVSLIEKDGVLQWCDDVPAEEEPSKLDIGPRRRRLRRRAGQSVPQVPAPAEMKDGPLVLTRTFPVLQPNKIVAAVGAIDRELNPALGESLHSRLRPLRKAADGTFSLGDAVTATLGPRTLLFVHGTFSNSANMLGEFKKTERGKSFLENALSGEKRYDNVVFFDHATLAISPIINALELGRFFAATAGQIDVIAHSRGGLVVRWWLEAFGKSLGVSREMPVRAVLVGSPLAGTSLAAPDKLQGVLSLISNIGAYAEATLGLVGSANPFLWVAGALVHVVVSAAGTLANTPLVDGLVALIPGLCGQSAVNNNLELNCLRLGPCAVDPRYYAVQSNFETKEVGWKFWKYFRKGKIADVATNAIFRGPNDLVVDTLSMIDLGVPKLELATKPYNFGTNDKVWHCNYFQQQETIDYIETQFT